MTQDVPIQVKVISKSIDVLKRPEKVRKFVALANELQVERLEAKTAAEYQELKARHAIILNKKAAELNLND